MIYSVEVNNTNNKEKCTLSHQRVQRIHKTIQQLYIFALSDCLTFMQTNLRHSLYLHLYFFGRMHRVHYFLLAASKAQM